MGSAYTTIAADALARYARIRGASPVRLITGTDEHGEKIAASSAAAGMSSPQQHVDAVSAKFSRLWEALGVDPDAFVRTTQARHSHLVEAVLEKVWARGDIFKGSYEGYYCVGCEEYKDEGDLVPVEGDGGSESFHCPLHAKACDKRSEENYFFRLSRYEERVRELLAEGGGSCSPSPSSSSSSSEAAAAAAAASTSSSSPSPSSSSSSFSSSSSSSSAEAPASDLLAPFVSPGARRNEISAWASGGLRDFSISRASVSWGIPLPRDPAQTVYVWFDALLGYASALLTEEEAAEIERLRVESAGQGEGASSVAADAAIALLREKGWPPSLHLVGKDILRFHAAYWPGMCLAAGLPLPGAVFAHGFLTKDGKKMGKSLGNVLDPNDLVARFGADAVRFFFLAGVAFGSDGDYAAARFADTVNAALANTLGNLVNRSASLLHKFFEGGELPCSADEAVEIVDAFFADSSSSLPPPGTACKSATLAAVEASRSAYDAAALHEATASAVAAAAAGNAALDATAPWSLLKKAAADLAAAEAAGSDAEALRAAEAALRAGGASLVLALEAARLSAVALAPVVPALSARVLLSLGEQRTKSSSSGSRSRSGNGDGDESDRMISWQRDAAWGGLQGGRVLPVPSPVFSRIELSEEEGGAPAGGGKKGGGGGGGKQKQKQQPKKKKEATAPAA